MDYLSLLRRLVGRDAKPYDIGRELWSLSMDRVDPSGDWIYFPSWLLWGATPAAGVDPHLRLSQEDARQQRTERRAQKKAWRQSHDGRRAAVGRVLTGLELDEGIGRLVEEIVGEGTGTTAAALALDMLGLGVIDEVEAPTILHRMARTGTSEARVRFAVALLMARAEVAFGKEHADWRERENVRAHFRHLTTHGYEIGAGELAHLSEPFGIDSLDAPPPRTWSGTAAGDGTSTAARTASVTAVRPMRSDHRGGRPRPSSLHRTPRTAACGVSTRCDEVLTQLDAGIAELTSSERWAQHRGMGGGTRGLNTQRQVSWLISQVGSSGRPCVAGTRDAQEPQDTSSDATHVQRTGFVCTREEGGFRLTGKCPGCKQPMPRRLPRIQALV